MMNRYIGTYLLAMLLPLVLWAQEPETLIRYVKTDGAYTNDGKSWDTAKNNIQDAINDLYDQIKNTDKQGHVYVAAGTYYPTESTESGKDGTAYTAFKIYEGITVYGGFNATTPEASPSEREFTDKNSSPTPYYYGKKFTHVTILDGNHTNMGDKKNLEWNETKQQYTTTFPGNSYHVVWFATKGFDDNGRAIGLSKPARLDGCTVQGGYASNRTTTGARQHNSYGGGIYMVAGSYVDNCIVTQNVATRAGGAIYLDGGGEVDHSYVRYNQSLGVGISEGFGGGICVDGAGVVRHTVMAENVARMGGGLALLAEDVQPKDGNRYAPAAAGCVVGNNTTTTEAAGVYMRYGGVLNHLAIVNNRCNGANLVYHGRRYGRSAGIYIDKYGEVFNTVCWGGEVEANSNIQYAAYADASQTEQPHVHYSAFAQNEITDWSSTIRMDVFSLNTKNEDYANDGNYPEFINPTIRTSQEATNEAIAHFTGVGVAEKATELKVDNFAPLWQPYRNSYLRGKGVMLKEYDYAIDRWETLKQASIEEDFQGTKFSPKTALGAFVTRSEDITPHDDDKFLTLYVDPSRTSSKSIPHTSQDLEVGNSWENPLGNLNDALLYFSLKEGEEEGATSEKKGRILVKEGETNTRGNYMTGHLRSSSFIMVSNVEVYGGYPEALTGNDETGRDPIKYPTHVTGDIADDKYINNVHHLVRFGDVQNAVFDGFRLYAGNAASTAISTASSRHGGGVIVYTTANDKTCTNNVLRNCVIANCSALQGAGIYVTGLGQDWKNDPHREVSLTVENCIIHNNTSIDATPSAICARGENTTLTLNHCTVRGNVGYGVAATENAQVTMNNSVIHANAKVAMEEVATLATDASNVLTLYTNGTGTITGDYNLLDAGNSTTLPTGGTNNRAILTYTDNTANYPKFVNPTRNIGHSEEVDNTIYGGYPNFMPTNISPLVNAANSNGTNYNSATDITNTNTRNYGGLPDVGAIENTDLPEGGKVLYVTPNGSGTKDGSSWANAIAGNTIYNINGTRIVEDGNDVLTTDSRYCGSNGNYYYDADARPYAEESNHSKSFWGTTGTDGTGANSSSDHSITNTRRETYVSGLQYAVEKATASNGEITEVWVGNGTYTDWKGYVIRDKVAVYGGFPASTISNPGMKERKPLLSISIPASKENESLTKTDYETIIQVRETSNTENLPENLPDKMRKYVLYQPDVCLTTNSPNSEYGSNDNQSNTYRYNSANVGYVEYIGASWDGFTIQNGFINGLFNNRDGGAGVRMFRGMTLKNCIVKDNYNNGGSRSRGGGIYCDDGDGTSSAVINCFVINNRCEGSSDAYGGGMYMIVGTSYNSLFCNNHADTEGGGIFLECATFYNNTIVNNTSTGTGGMHHWIDGGRASKLAVYNCLFYENSGAAVGSENADDLEPFYNCYVQTATEFELVNGVNVVKNKIPTDAVYNNQYGVGDALANPFADDDYSKSLNLRLAGTSACINAGMNEPNNITLPDTDVDFATRIQDCTVDIGAYEYNGAANIVPTLADNVATYYVTQNGRGAATATDPANAACWTKLQKVLDAAGRYKFNNPATQVIVKLAAFPAGGDAGYMPRRSSVTEANNPDAENPRTYSIMVPRGVEVWGGYTDAYTDESNHGFLNRNITTNKTTLSGLYQAEGQDVNVYHVVTFTDNTFDTEGKVTENLLSDEGKISAMGNHNKAILDGLFITGGLADGVKAENQRGGAAVLPDYAHVRNCIVHTNEASEEGGALYMQPRSLVSGTLLVNNRSGNRGGAIFVEEPVVAQDIPDAEAIDTDGTYARVFTSTIVRNSALQGGGINFQTNLRANSVVVWGNDANMQDNIAGQLDPFSTQASSSQTMNDYPLSFSAVENMHAAGINNLQLHAEEDKGVRFVKDGLYGLTPTSVLVRAGMRYEDYEAYLAALPTLEQEDFAKTDRIGHDNDYIDIGARAINTTIHATTGVDNLLTRLYVVSPELDIDLDLQKTLMNSSDAKYKQQGSSFANPMIRLDDALDYIRKARKSNIDGVNNKKFEIFVSRGTFYPLRTIRGEYSYSRANTYLVPEGVSIIGGMDTKVNYGQGETDETAGSTIEDIQVSSEYRDEWLTTYDTYDTRIQSYQNSLIGKSEYWAENLKYSESKTTQTFSDKKDHWRDDLSLGEVTSIRTGINSFKITVPYTVDDTPKSKEVEFTIGGESYDFVDLVEATASYSSRYSTNFTITVTCTYKGYKYEEYRYRTIKTNIITTVTGATTIAMRDARLHYDLNNNGIIEPWEMKEQTILSGANVNSVNSENVYHVIAAIPAEQWVGKLPGTSDIAGKDQTALESASEKGTKHVEQGARILLDGLYISDGHAYDYEPNFVGSTHTYYKGGAICVDGNWVTKTTTDGETTQEDMFLNTNVHNPLGYRNIPLTVVNCQFSNNIGGMGGAIFSNGDLEIYDCSFTQNKSMGREDKENSATIARYTGNGGAVNASGRLVAVNTLFANNEAQAGDYIAIDDDDIQNTGGWGGAILAGEHCRLHILNCNFVRNKATNYPAIYNYVSNAGWEINGVDYSPGNKESNDYTSMKVRINNPHRVVSSIFWGNEAKGIHKSMYYGPTGHEVEHLWFCAYGANCGLPSVSVPPTDDFDYRKVKFHFHNDDGVTRAAYIPALFQHYYTEKVRENGTLPTDPDPAPWKVTNNVILNTENTALDGPNFINPSQTAGVAGYMAGADWMMSRINNLVDNGWTYLEQENDVFPTPITKVKGSGIYKKIADVFEENHNGFTLMPYGDQEYMYYPELSDDGTHHRKMLRISNDPNSTTNETFIDIGLYEYQHVSLTSASTDAVDILWVAEHERQDIDGPADGHDWLHATSDLQRAIETLLSSRNGNPKEIRIIEGTYMPVYTINENLGFHISTESANETVVYAEKTESDAKGIQSLTIRGGYSSEMADVYDYNKYPVHIVSAERSGVSPDKFKHLFFIEDARQRKSYKGDDNLTHTAENEVIPITLSGLTFTNSKAVTHEHHQEHNYQGGAAIYYADQLKDDKNGENYISGDDGKTLLIAPTNGKGKRLTISNCIFLQNGVAGNTEVPAVSIGKGGGDALIYNSLFHSNTGDPLLAWDTKIINSTFALNGGVVKLDNPMDGKLDNPMDGYASELHNSVLWRNNQNQETDVTEISGLASDVTYTHNAISISEITKDESNSPLSGDNDDIMNGPNFFDPENSDPTARDFRIKPSAVLLSGASDELFAKMVLGSSAESDFQSVVADTTDLAYFQPRSYGKGLDRGAYECHEKLNRIIYVDPNQVTRTGTGESWEQAYEYGRLQNAIDATFVYAMEAETSENKVAYVFVKGKREGSTDEAITLRNGVQVYGSIDPGYTQQVAAETNTDGNITYTEEALKDYVTQLRTDRPGLAGTNTYRTVVKGVTTTASAYYKQTLLDGFVVSNPTPTTTPAVDLKGDGHTQNSLAIRNSIIAGNTVTGENQPPVVNVENGLLYNVLVQENTTNNAPTVKIGDKGYVVNATVVANGNAIQENNSANVLNSIAYNLSSDEISPFAPYFQSGTIIGYHADKPAYLKDNHYLWYQLHEEATYLDAGNNDITTLNNFIDYTNDRDILGNKRMFNGKVDMGCFETWNINSNQELDYVPAEGSVVYVQEGANLQLKSGLSQTFSPGYLLLREGASLYGQGARVELNYVAVEKEMPQAYSLLSLPYAYDFAHTVTATVDHGVLTETPITSTVYTYDGEARAAHGYHFVTKDSECWDVWDNSTSLPANKGVLFTGVDAGTYRFTAFAPTASDRLYTEGGTETSKAVTLTQYNSTPTNGSADFTSAENMGWNLVGMPYLVNRYATHTMANGTYQMHIPHVFYTLKDDGNYETTQSWKDGKDGSTLSLGNAFFTQTATLDATEQLQFKLPVYVQAQTIDTRALLNITSEEGSDAVQLNPDSEVTELTDFQLNYDGVKLLSMNNRLPQIYALGNRGSHLSLMGSAPVEKEISLGFYAAKSDASYTLSLPNREAFASYGGVWLKDNLTGITCNLLEEDYTLTTTRTGNHSDRLTVQIGGTSPTPSLEGWRNDNAHVVHVADGTLRLNHLQTGKSIRVYTTDGRLVHQSIATGNTHTIAVPVGTYIIIYNL